MSLNVGNKMLKVQVKADLQLSLFIESFQTLKNKVELEIPSVSAMWVSHRLAIFWRFSLTHLQVVFILFSEVSLNNLEKVVGIADSAF